jgi:ABC-type branched-subunit amino acid transport system permease subunit
VRATAAFAYALGGALVAAGGVLVSMFLTFNASLGVVFTMKALIVVIMGGVGNLLGCLVAGMILGLTETFRRDLYRSGPDARRHLRHLHSGAVAAPAGPVRNGGHERAPSRHFGWACGLVVLLAFVPSVANGYQLSLAINIMNYTVLATAWTLFSGPTRYVSLATVAFFGIGAYTVAVLGEVLAWPLVLLIAFVIGFILSLLVGLSTLRLSGVYFVIFTFGLAELVRQLVTWYEVNVTRTLGRYVFVDITTEQIYWQLLGSRSPCSSPAG